MEEKHEGVSIHLKYCLVRIGEESARRYIMNLFLADKWRRNDVLRNTVIRTTIYLGPVVQNVVSLTSSLRGQLVKCFTTL